VSYKASSVGGGCRPAPVVSVAASAAQDAAASGSNKSCSAASCHYQMPQQQLSYTTYLTNLISIHPLSMRGKQAVTGCNRLQRSCINFEHIHLPTPAHEQNHTIHIVTLQTGCKVAADELHHKPALLVGLQHQQQPTAPAPFIYTEQVTTRITYRSLAVFRAAFSCPTTCFHACQQLLLQVA
jgi:hypothetical protein